MQIAKIIFQQGFQDLEMSNSSFRVHFAIYLRTPCFAITTR